jgi:glycosyltransferase involved in cell wall biosynthesis
MDYPLVSAIVLCYNQGKYVRECLDSVAIQKYPNLELIVNDDASSDNSAALIENWLTSNKLPFRFLRSQKNQGLCRSLNNALSQAKGKYIAGIAADDIWLPGKLIKQVEMMEQLPERVGVIYTDAFRIDEGGGLLEGRFIQTYRCFKEMPTGDIYQTLWGGNFIPAMTTLIRAKCFTEVGLYDESLYYEDWDMWLRIARRFAFAYGAEVSAKYRIVSTSMMQSQKERMIDALCQVSVKHLQNGNIDGATRATAGSRLYEDAIASYERKTPRHKQNLLNAFRYRPTAGLAIRGLLAMCGVEAKRFGRLRGILGIRQSC